MSQKTKIILALAAILVLAAAAYLAATLSTAQATAGNQSPKGPEVAANGKQIVRIYVTPAPESPTTQVDLMGKLVEKKDNSLMVIPAVKGGDTSSGPSTEVVITGQTILYRDATLDGIAKPRPGTTEQVFQQKLIPCTIDEIVGEDVTVQAWGERRGDRLIATTVIVGQNVMVKK